MSLWRAVGVLGAVLVVSALFGAGLGFVQTELAMLRHPFTARATYGAGSAQLGAVVGAVLGPIVYLVVVRRRLGAEQLLALLALLALPGMVTAAAMSFAMGEGWPSVVVTALSAVAVPAAFWAGARRP